MPNRAIILALVVATTAVPAQAAPAYRASGFLRTGYSETVTGPGEWIVKGSGREPGKGVAVALYRAAELVAATGATELRVVRQSVRTQTISDRTGYQRSFREQTSVTVKAVRALADRLACAMADAAQCMTLPVAGVLATYGERLAMPVARPGTAPAPALAIVTRSDYQQAVVDLLARRPELSAAPVAIAPVAPRPVARAAAVPLPVARSAAAVLTSEQVYAARLKAAQPVSSGLGWKISD